MVYVIKSFCSKHLTQVRGERFKQKFDVVVEEESLNMRNYHRKCFIFDDKCYNQENL